MFLYANGSQENSVENKRISILASPICKKKKKSFPLHYYFKRRTICH